MTQLFTEKDKQWLIAFLFVFVHIIYAEEGIVALSFILFIALAYNTLSSLIKSVLNETSFKLYKQINAYNKAFLDSKFVFTSTIAKNRLPLEQLLSIYKVTSIFKTRLVMKLILILINNIVLNIVEIYKSIKAKQVFTKSTISALLVENIANILRENAEIAEQYQNSDQAFEENK